MLFSKIKRTLLNNENASILIMTLVVSLMLVVFSAGILTLVSTDARGTLQTARLDSALNVAEAGVEEALWEFKFGGADFNSTDGWSGSDSKTKLGTLQTNNGETIGQYLTTVTDLSGDPKIEVTGYIPNQANALSQRKIKVLVNKTQDSDFNMAAFGTESVDFDKEILTDSYNSTQGDYDPAYVPDMGHIGTDSTESGAITLDKEVEIHGNVIIGPGGVPAEVISNPEELEISPIVASEAANPQPKAAPTGLPLQSDINLGKESTTTISADGQYGTISLGEESVLTIDNDAIIYVTEEFDFDKESELRVINNAKVKIYLGDVDFSLDKAVAINNESKNPAAFGVYGTSDFTGTIQIKKETEFYGVIHAPNGTIDINKEAEIYGALVAKEIVLDKESAIHYDEALLTAAGGAWSSYSVAKWQEK